jgi:regulator of sigma E protease
MLLMIYSVVVVVLLFGLTVFVHELGHFLVARRCGLVIDVFSIGFGPAVWKKEVNGITYKIGCLPLGGYVALPQMDPGDSKDEKKKDNGENRSGEEAPEQEEPVRDLPPVAPWKKILVSLAGAIGNLILAVILACIVYWGGQSYAPEKTNIVGYITTNSPAYAQGLRIGDEIAAVNGKPVNSWDEFIVECALVSEPELEIIRNDKSRMRMEIPTEEFLGSSMIEGIAPVNYCYVLRVRPGSSAHKAGLESGDRIHKLDDEVLYSREHLVETVDNYRNQTVTAVVERDGKMIEVAVTPEYDEEYGRALIGIEFNPLDVRPPLQQIRSHAMLVFRLLKALLTPSQAKAAASAVGGPVAILTMFWYSVQSSMLLALSFTCLVNVNLAVLNLLPIPVLDGGHILFSLWEMITRRPIHKKVVDTMVNVFAVLLIMLFLLLSFRDVKRLIIPIFTSGQAAEAVATNAPPE